MNIQITYFSGTGCTEHVAKTFCREFTARGNNTVLKNLVTDSSLDPDMDILVICFVVHACNAPQPVMQWVTSLEKKGNPSVVVISVSGGGEVTPNLACRVPIKRALKKRKFDVVYEKMLVMPSNWIVETKQTLAVELLRVLPQKVSYIVHDVLDGVRRKTHPLAGNRILALLGALEHFGARSFGKNIRVDSGCTGCGLCAAKCPASNIVMIENKPTFLDRCILCLNCLYSCPAKALHPTMMKFVAIPNGFNFKALLALPRNAEAIDIRKETKGLAWIGVRRYLSDTSDMREPEYTGDKIL